MGMISASVNASQGADLITKEAKFNHIKIASSSPKVLRLSNRKARKLLGIYDIQIGEDAPFNSLEITEVSAINKGLTSFTYNIYSDIGSLVVGNQTGMIVRGNMIFHSPAIDGQLVYILRLVVGRRIIGAGGLVNAFESSISCDTDNILPIVSNTFTGTMNCGLLITSLINPNGFDEAIIVKR
ncbi:MAG: hypothetical protein HRT47_13595 [Candidatus Caenarcaniphilales bacterium]|nr:hypothetical protein [Candidatus Caenarcaniphilales bacterium]